MFSVGAFCAGRCFAIQIRNFMATSPIISSFGRVLDHFVTVGEDMTGGGQGFMFGPCGSLTDDDQKKLMEVGAHKPRRASDFRHMLAAINRRASRTPGGKNRISAACVTTYIPPAYDPAQVAFHDAEGIPAALNPHAVPQLLFGIDTTEIMRDAVKEIATRGGSLASWDSESATRRAVVSKNRLRQ